MSVKEIMHETTIVKPTTSVLEASKLMRDKNIGSVLVKVNDLDYGIVTERDILFKVISKELSPKRTTVKDTMTELRYTIDSNATIQKASELFNIHHIRRLPVMENGELVGMITARDVAKRCVFRYYKTMQDYSKEESKKGWR
ncbi:MAG: CBS domain-containing protein [Candidatus Hydrothermarchaeota archaeon]|jgi:CBS domain-containing protein|nr:CBS domain-containing protein [Candidatus Hydrothermarchaeota archaeon]